MTEATYRDLVKRIESRRAENARQQKADDPRNGNNGFYRGYEAALSALMNELYIETYGVNFPVEEDN